MAILSVGAGLIDRRPFRISRPLALAKARS
jgi:hypothetical protein